MAFEVGDFTIRMRPFNNQEEYRESMMGWNSQKVMKYMDLGPFGTTESNEEKFFQSMIDGKKSVYWAIEHIEDEKLIGYTQFFSLDQFARTAKTTIMIWNSKYWNQKVTSHVHLARTYYGAKILNLAVMKSYVLADNTASFKSLQKIGYEMFGTLESYYFVEGRYLDAHHLVWYNPSEKDSLFPNGASKLREEQLKRAENSLIKAKKMITFP